MQPRSPFSRNFSATMKLPSASIPTRLSCLIRWTAVKIYSYYITPLNVLREWGGLECWRKLPALIKLVLEKFWWMKFTQVFLKRCENFEVGWKKVKAWRILQKLLRVGCSEQGSLKMSQRRTFDPIPNKFHWAASKKGQLLIILPQ